MLEKLKDITKTDMVAKSSGFFGLVKDKSATDIARIKATLMLCYGFVTLYAKANLITSRVEVNILATINPHFTNVKETQVKENLIRCVDLIGKSLHPSHLKSDKFILHRRGDLLSHMLAYMKAESKERLSTEIRALSMDACTTLLTLEPKLADAELFEMVDAATQAALDLGPVDDDSADMAELMQQVLKSLKRLLSTILRKDVSPSCLESIMKHLGRWMDAKKVLSGCTHGLPLGLVLHNLVACVSVESTPCVCPVRGAWHFAMQCACCSLLLLNAPVHGSTARGCGPPASGRTTSARG